jgi:hypothetical protein
MKLISIPIFLLFYSLNLSAQNHDHEHEHESHENHNGFELGVG